MEKGEFRVDSGGKLTGGPVVDRRGLFAFVELTSFIFSEQPPSAEGLHDRNQSEGNRPYSAAETPTHRYEHWERRDKGGGSRRGGVQKRWNSSS